MRQNEIKKRKKGEEKVWRRIQERRLKNENKQETKFCIFRWNHDIIKSMIGFHWSLHEQHSLSQNV